jgi:hypothetical protein
MPENFPAGQFLTKADKAFAVCIVNKSMSSSLSKIKGTQARNFFKYFFCRNRNHMVPLACNTRFLKIVFDLAEIFDF